MEMLRGIPESAAKEQQRPISVNRVLQDGWESALKTDDYERAKESLGQLSEFSKWRQAANSSPFPQFYQFIEAATLANKASASSEERAEIVDKLTPLSRALSPRNRDLFFSFLSDIDDSSYTPKFEMTQRQHESLKDAGDLSLLQNPDVSWDVKLNRVKTRIENELKGRNALDRIDKEKKEAEQGERKRSEQKTPPPDRDESKPGMDEMERLKEGEAAPAIWTISPARDGYFKEQSFDVWDREKNVWKNGDKNWNKEVAGLSVPSRADNVILGADIPGGQFTRIPVPYKHEITGALSTDKIGNQLIVFKDQNGDYILKSDASSRVKVEMREKETARLSENPPTKPLDIPAKLSKETEEAVEEISKTRKGNLARARSLVSYTMRHLEYSNDSSYNALYEGHPDGYIGAIDQFKKADCDVANTYFAGLCSKLDIPVRHVVGHMVKGKDKEGNSRITSGTGHAWSEAWDEQSREWVRVDATPPGDPQQEEDKKGEEAIPGDYGEQEAIGPTGEELQSLQEKLEKHTEELSYTREERELSEATGVELKEARKIVKEILEAENTRLPGGERVVDVMARMWDIIRDSRKTKVHEYTGPLRKREGGEAIENIVAHSIGIRSGDSDPMSRQKEHEEELVEQVIREMQVRIIGDKSGSMSNTVDGEIKWQLQRRAIYLTLSSLHREEQNLKKFAKHMKEPLSLSSQVISFRGKKDIDEDKSLSDKFRLIDKVNLWKSLGNQGSGNGDIAALTHYRDEITKERQEKEKKGEKDNTLRVIIACSDGEPDSAGGVHQLAEELGAMNTVTVGVGMTETAAKVPVIFDTPHSKGDFAKDLSDLPAILVKHVIVEAVKLFPQKNKAQYQKSIDALLAKFDKVGVR